MSHPEFDAIVKRLVDSWRRAWDMEQLDCVHVWTPDKSGHGGPPHCVRCGVIRV